jgi:hypothetical protein
MNTHVTTTLRGRIDIAASQWPAHHRPDHSRWATILVLTIVSLAALATPGFARSSTGYNSFKIQYPFTPSQAGYNCMFEDYGAVWNDCGVTVYLMFDLAIDNTGQQTVNVWNYWNGSGSNGVSCSVWTYDHSGGASRSGFQTFTATGQEKLTWLSPYVYATQAITLFCTVPPAQGIASVEWRGASD